MTTLTPTRKLLKKQAVLDLKGVFREEAFAAVNPDIGAALLLALPDDEERQQSLHTLCGPQRAAIFEATPPEVLRIMLAHIGPVDMKHTLHSMRGNHGKELVALMPAKIREAVIEQLNDEEKEALQIQVDAGHPPTEALARVSSGLLQPATVDGGGPEGHCTIFSFLHDSERLKIIEEWDRCELDGVGLASMRKEEFLQNESTWLQRVYGVEMSPQDLDETYNFWTAHDMAHTGTKGKLEEGQIRWAQFSEAKAMLVLDMRDMLVKCLTQEEIDDCKATFDAIEAPYYHIWTNNPRFYSRYRRLSMRLRLPGTPLSPK